MKDSLGRQEGRMDVVFYDITLFIFAVAEIVQDLQHMFQISMSIKNICKKHPWKTVKKFFSNAYINFRLFGKMLIVFGLVIDVTDKYLICESR